MYTCGACPQQAGEYHSFHGQYAADVYCVVTCKTNHVKLAQCSGLNTSMAGLNDTRQPTAGWHACVLELPPAASSRKFNVSHYLFDQSHGGNAFAQGACSVTVPTQLVSSSASSSVTIPSRKQQTLWIYDTSLFWLHKSSVSLKQRDDGAW